MSGLRGILAGALTLITLHTLVAYQGPSQRISDLSRLAVGLVDTFLSPDKPAIPDLTSPAPAVRSPDAARTPWFRKLPPPAPR